jgi:SAM-dependent methyltransferase
MSLRDATCFGGTPPLPPGPPYACRDLLPWAGLAFDLPVADPRLRAIHDGAAEPTPPLANLVGARTAWADWPAHMDFLDRDSPMYAQKRAERQLYLERWERHVPPGSRVLDLGGGIGRFTQWCLDRGCTVELVDPDLRSLRAAVRHAAGRPGALDVHWATGERLPDLAPVDVVIAAEVLCYVEDVATVLAGIRRVLRPGGPLLVSVEARWGWAAAYDAPPGSLDALLGDGVLHVPGDRWVRTYERADLEHALADWAIEELVPTHYIPCGPFETAAGPLAFEALLAWEERLRAHPMTAPWNRAWMAVARATGG